MRQRPCTITPALVRSTAHAAWQRALPFQRYGRRVTAQRRIDLLLLVAALRSSLSAVTRRFRFGFSHETARQAVIANLPGQAALQQGRRDALHAFGSRRLRRRRWDIAIDLPYGPFYGDRHTPGVLGGPKKQGRKYHYAYASAALIHRRHRYTVGRLALERTYRPHEVVAARLEQRRARGLRLRGVALDSGFDSGETILWLPQRGLSYVMPLRQKGHGPNPGNACWALPVGTVTSLAWRTQQSRRPVRTEMVVVRLAEEPAVKVYAFGGGAVSKATAQRRAQQAWRAYRRRFGIETSYRQRKEGKGRTTKKDVC